MIRRVNLNRINNNNYKLILQNHIDWEDFLFKLFFQLSEKDNCVGSITQEL